jgi:hypothetical protein
VVSGYLDDWFDSNVTEGRLEFFGNPTILDYEKLTDSVTDWFDSELGLKNTHKVYVVTGGDGKLSWF